MKKSKGQTLDLLYTNNSNKNNEKKVKTSKKTKNTKKTNAKNTANRQNQTINLDNEIIIGLTPKKEKQTSNTKKKNSNKNSKKQKKQATNKNGKKKNNIKNNKSKKKNNKLKIIKWTTIIVIILATIILFMMSSVFNIKQIIVINNNKIPTEQIIRSSTLTIGNNMFKTTNKTIREGIKTNPYVEDVIIKRNINGTVTLDVKERIPTYMLRFANAYVYINNQGYMLEITETPIELPTIIGFGTPTDSIKEGNRLIVDDLKKLDDVNKIMESARSNSLANIITQIDISNSANYILKIASEAKTVQLGDITNVNIKLLKVEALIEQEKGIEGEIYFQDSEKTVFREKVTF